MRIWLPKECTHPSGRKETWAQANQKEEDGPEEQVGQAAGCTVSLLWLQVDHGLKAHLSLQLLHLRSPAGLPER